MFFVLIWFSWWNNERIVTIKSFCCNHSSFDVVQWFINWLTSSLLYNTIRNYVFKHNLSAFFVLFVSKKRMKKKSLNVQSLGLELGLYFAKCSNECSTHFFCQFQSQIFTFTKKKNTYIKFTGFQPLWTTLKLHSVWILIHNFIFFLSCLCFNFVFFFFFSLCCKSCCLFNVRHTNQTSSLCAYFIYKRAISSMVHRCSSHSMHRMEEKGEKKTNDVVNAPTHWLLLQLFQYNPESIVSQFSIRP